MVAIFFYQMADLDHNLFLLTFGRMKIAKSACFHEFRNCRFSIVLSYRKNVFNFGKNCDNFVNRRFFLFLSVCYLSIYIVFLQILFDLLNRLKTDSVNSGFFGSLDIFHPVIDKYTLIRCELIFF